MKGGYAEDDGDARHAAVSAMVGRGTMFSLLDGQGLIAQRNENATILVYSAFRTWPEETDRPNRALDGITPNDLLARFDGWAPSMLALIEDADRVAAVRPIVALSVHGPLEPGRPLLLAPCWITNWPAGIAGIVHSPFTLRFTLTCQTADK